MKGRERDTRTRGKGGEGDGWGLRQAWGREGQWKVRGGRWCGRQRAKVGEGR